MTTIINQFAIIIFFGFANYTRYVVPVVFIVDPPVGIVACLFEKPIPMRYVMVSKAFRLALVRFFLNVTYFACRKLC